MKLKKLIKDYHSPTYDELIDNLIKMAEDIPDWIF